MICIDFCPGKRATTSWSTLSWASSMRSTLSSLRRRGIGRRFLYQRSFVVCLRTLSIEETYVCFSQVSQLEGRVKQLEQELLDTRDGAGDKLDLPVGKMQVCLSNFQAYPCYEAGFQRLDQWSHIIFRRVQNNSKIVWKASSTRPTKLTRPMVADQRESVASWTIRGLVTTTKPMMRWWSWWSWWWCSWSQLWGAGGGRG